MYTFCKKYNFYRHFDDIWLLRLASIGWQKPIDTISGDCVRVTRPFPNRGANPLGRPPSPGVLNDEQGRIDRRATWSKATPTGVSSSRAMLRNG